jgi:hypothetical protein
LQVQGGLWSGRRDLYGRWAGAAKTFPLAAATREIKVDVPRVVEVTLKQHKLPETMQGGILDHLIREGDLSQYGLGNAFTRYAQDLESYESATQLEEIGADVMAMDERAWSRLTDLATALS